MYYINDIRKIEVIHLDAFDDKEAAEAFFIKMLNSNGDFLLKGGLEIMYAEDFAPDATPPVYGEFDPELGKFYWDTEN